MMDKLYIASLLTLILLCAIYTCLVSNTILKKSHFSHNNDRQGRKMPKKNETKSLIETLIVIAVIIVVILLINI